MQRLNGKKEEKKDEIIVSFLNRDDLNYFNQLPLDLQYAIIAQVISIEIPQFFRDISQLSLVSKQFLNVCKKFVERHVLDIQLRVNLMESRNQMLKEYEQLYPSDINAVSESIFADYDAIQDKISATKRKLRQGLSRNHFILGRSDNRSCLRNTMSLLGIFMLPFMIYVLVRNSQCDGEILTTKGWDNQTGNKRMHCLYAPITDFAVELFHLDFNIAALVMGILFEIIAGPGSILAVAGLERLLHLLFDGIQLLVLKYQEHQELIRLATDRTTPLYEVCRQYLATIKWEEKLFQHANNIEAVKDLNEIKTTESYQLMHLIATLGNAYRFQIRRNLFLEPELTEGRSAEVAEVAEVEEPLLSHRTQRGYQMV